MSLPQGISKLNFLSPAEATDGVLHSISLKGGYQEMLTKNDRNNIKSFANSTGAVYDGFTHSNDVWSTGRRRVGMMVYVVEENKIYNLIPVGFFGNDGELEEADWISMPEWERALRLDPSGEFTSEPPIPSNNFTPVIKTAVDIGISPNPDLCWVQLSVGSTSDASNHLHIAYANDTEGNGFSTTDSVDKLYMGQYADNNVVASEDYTKYTWSRIKGADGTSVNIKGSADSVSDLPANNNSTNGDGYLVGGVLYVFNGISWIEAGRIQGPQGLAGANAKTVKLSPSKHVISYSTEYNEETKEFTDVETDTITFTATPQNIEGTATYKYYINNESQGAKSTTPTFDLPDNKEPSNGESIIVKVELYDDDILVAEDSVSIYGVKDGYNPVKGRDYDDGIAGNNVIVEYSIDKETWVTTQAADVTYYYIRTGVQTNGEGDFVYGPATKFVPTLGTEYNNGDPGVSSYLHIKYSDNGTSFTGNVGEDVGDYIGTYVDGIEADSTTFNDYTWKKILGESALTSFLTNATHVISADSDGSVTGEYSEAGGTFKVLLGTTDITTQCTFTEISDNGANLTTDITQLSGIYSISEITVNSSTAIFQATVPKSITNTDEDVILTQTYSISKSQRGEEGYTPILNKDYFNGTDGTFTSFIFKVSSGTPDTPTLGTYNGTNEIIPVDWSDDPTANLNDTEWMSTTKYSHNRVTGGWSNSGWSTPTRIYQKGEDGTSINIKGSVDNVNELPTDNNSNGDSYLIEGVLYVFDGANFIQTGRIQGPQGIPGAKAKTVKLSPSKHVINYSTDETETDTITFTATPQNVEGIATYEFYIDGELKSSLESSSTFTLSDDDEPANGESVVVKVKLHDDGVLVATDEVSIYGVKDGYSPVRGTDYNSGDNVRVEYSIDGENWVTTQVNGTIYYHIRTAVQTNGEGDYIPGLATKFVPELGVDYNNGSYLHIKYSDNGTSFTGNGGEDVGDYIGTYVDKTEADSTTFNDYTWKKILGESALTSFLTNATHVISADKDGNVTGNLNEAGGTFKVLLGTTDITTQCTFTEISNLGITATIDNDNNNDTPKGVYIISQMTANSGVAIFQAEVPNSLTNTDEDVILTQTYSISKSQTGENGIPGAGAKAVKLIPSKHVINYSTDGIESDTITFTAFRQNIEGTAEYEFYVGDTKKQNLDFSSTFTLLDNDEPANGESVVVKVKLYDNGTLVAEDSVSIYGVKDGSDALTSFLTNATHVISADKDGNVTGDLNEAGGTFKVLLGTTDITSQCTFSIDSNNTNITAAISSNEESKGLYSISGISSNSGVASFKATVPNSLTNTDTNVILTQTYSISKSQKGDTPILNQDYFNGTNGTFTSFIFKVSSGAPDTPTLGSFNGSVEIIPVDWSDDPTANLNDTEWMSTTKYSHNRVTGGWSNSGWSTPTRIYQKGDTGDTGDTGDKGDKGDTGESGLNAQTVKLSPSKHVINYNFYSLLNIPKMFNSRVFSDGGTMESLECIEDVEFDETDTIIFTTTPQNVEGTATYEYYINNESQGAPSNNPKFTLPDNAEPTSGENVVVKVKLYDNGTLVAEDSVSIYGVQDGSSSPTGFLTNETHVVPADENGNVSDYTDAGGTFEVFLGGTNVTTACDFEVEVQTDIDVSIDQNGVYTINSMSASRGKCRFKATIPDDLSVQLKGSPVYIYKTYVIAKSQKGERGLQGGKGNSGKRTTSGVLFYQSGRNEAPDSLKVGDYSFDFDTGQFNNMSSDWSHTTPQMEAGTSSNNYWSTSYYVEEGGVAVFQDPIRSFAFNQVVTFDSLGSEGTTTIDGGRITTGVIKNSTFSGNSNWDTYSSAGMGINLDNGAINAKNFYITPGGDAKFKGDLDLDGNVKAGGVVMSSFFGKKVVDEVTYLQMKDDAYFGNTKVSKYKQDVTDTIDNIEIIDGSGQFGQVGQTTLSHGYIKRNDVLIEVGDLVKLDNNNELIKASTSKDTGIVGILWEEYDYSLKPSPMDKHRLTPRVYVEQDHHYRDSFGTKLPEIDRDSKSIWKVASIGDTFEGSLLGMKVCNQNGPVNIGDLVCSSDIPGYVMKQPVEYVIIGFENDIPQYEERQIINSFTVGKCMETCSFNSEGKVEEIYGYLYCG